MECREEGGGGGGGGGSCLDSAVTVGGIFVVPV